jgi:RHS repeat-associated protein
MGIFQRIIYCIAVSVVTLCVIWRLNNTAFGERCKGDWRVSDPLPPIIPALTNRGFTGHEHIDEMGLIHMNGRVYDPQIGRFLSTD